MSTSLVMRSNTHAADEPDCGGPSTTPSKHPSTHWESLKPSPKRPGEEQVDEMIEWCNTNPLTLPPDEMLPPERYQPPATLPFSVSYEWVETFRTTLPEPTKGHIEFRHFESSKTKLWMRVISTNDTVIKYQWLFKFGGSILMKQTSNRPERTYIEVATSKAHNGYPSAWKADGEIINAIPTLLADLKKGLSDDD